MPVNINPILCGKDNLLYGNYEEVKQFHLNLIKVLRVYISLCVVLNIDKALQIYINIAVQISL